MSGDVEVLSVSGPALVQDGGRAGHLHEGIPPGGALVPELLALANRAVGNAWDAAALECFGALTLAVRGGPLTLAINGELLMAADGAVIEVPRPEQRLRYLAFSGGLDVPRILDGCGTLAVASFGGFEGRALRRGDLLKVLPLDKGRRTRPLPALPGGDAPLRVIRGPDEDRFPPEAYEALFARPFQISPRSDRVGIRLGGTLLPRRDGDSGISMPMARGAIQVPAGGEPIVLGPDHPTTGGYPVIATVIRADQGLLGAARPGSAVRFVECSVEEARAAFRELAQRFLK